MKHLVRFFVVTLLFLICTYASAEQKIVYIDMKFVLNNSKAGKGAQDYLQKLFTDSQKNFSKKENELKEEEKDLLLKKTVLSQDEYKKKTDELRKKVINHQAQRRKVIEKITKQRTDARKELLKILDPILKKYSTEENISLVINKKNVVVGSNDLDITNIIVQKLDKELPSLNLK